MEKIEIARNALKRIRINVGGCYTENCKSIGDALNELERLQGEIKELKEDLVLYETGQKGHRP